MSNQKRMFIIVILFNIAWMGILITKRDKKHLFVFESTKNGQSLQAFTATRSFISWQVFNSSHSLFCYFFQFTWDKMNNRPLYRWVHVIAFVDANARVLQFSLFVHLSLIFSIIFRWIFAHIVLRWNCFTRRHRHWHYNFFNNIVSCI